MSKWMRRATVVVAAFVVMSMLTAFGVASADEPPPIVNNSLPTVSGTAQYRSTLNASPGEWTPAEVETANQWLRNGTPITGATAATYTLALADIGKKISVRVTATQTDWAAGVAVSAQTVPVARAVIRSTKRPSISGTRKFRKTLTASPGKWSVSGLRVSYRWLRQGKAIARATKRKYKLAPSDVGTRISVRVTVSKAGYVTTSRTSARTVKIRHLRPVRKTVTYRVVKRGKVTASLSTFRAQARATLNDPRGWRGTGVAFKEVSKGGSFTLVLSQASKVPSYSSACSSTYSCRVGRYVIINQTRWLHASPAWHKAGGSLRNYRHLVINHEVGHWLGHGHASCGGKGRLAPVMQQQSKGLHGCKINSWPKPSELSVPRFGIKR